MANTVISYPIPAYQNVPIQPQFYKPSQFFIAAISLGPTTTVQTTVDNNYEIGQEVRLIIPASFGCYQLNGKTGLVLDTINDDTVILNINSSQNVDQYIASTDATQAQIVAIGDINSGNISANGAFDVPTNIIGSFINISPE